MAGVIGTGKFVVGDCVRMKEDHYPTAKTQDTKDRRGMKGKVIATLRGGEEVRVEWQDSDRFAYPWFFLESCEHKA